MAVVATGFFDGVHLGHRQVIQTLVSSARQKGEEAIVVTFAQHPRAVLQQDARELRLLNSPQEKEALLRALGVDRVEVLPFDRAFARLTAEQYIRTVLQERLGATRLVLGYDNRLGSDRLTPDQIAPLAQSLGLEVVIVPAAVAGVVESAAASPDRSHPRLRKREGPAAEGCGRGPAQQDVSGGTPLAGETPQITVKTADGKEYKVSRVILATGHSARDVYEMLQAAGGALEPKGFAMGVRVEHPQEKINWCQYHGQWKPGVPAAEYSFVEQVDGRGVFSFCMCPGGILVPSSTEERTVVLNGMSNSGRSGKFANAGVVVQIEPEDVPGEGPFKLMDFQHDVERRMYDYAQSQGAANPMAAPAQRMEDFCLGKVSKTMPPTSYHPGVVSAPLHELLPPIVAQRLQKAFPRVKMRNYYTNAALLLGVESRTSSPVRIPRDPETLEYVSLPGIYPCGEGAGYAGGIVSSALDGINVATAVAASLIPRS